MTSISHELVAPAVHLGHYAVFIRTLEFLLWLTTFILLFEGIARVWLMATSFSAARGCLSLGMAAINPLLFYFLLRAFFAPDTQFGTLAGTRQLTAGFILAAIYFLTPPLRLRVHHLYRRFRGRPVFSSAPTAPAKILG